jgi:hypothetical protein
MSPDEWLTDWQLETLHTPGKRQAIKSRFQPIEFSGEVRLTCQVVLGRLRWLLCFATRVARNGHFHHVKLFKLEILVEQFGRMAVENSRSLFWASLSSRRAV